MNSLIAHALALGVKFSNVVTAVVLAAFAGIAIRAFVQAALGQRLLPASARRKRLSRWRRAALVCGHLSWGAVMLAFGGLYGVLVLSSFDPTLVAVLAAAGTLVLILGSLGLSRLLGITHLRGITAVLLRLVLLLSLAVLALLTLMRAGFLALTEDRPVLLVQLTGATDTELVEWAAPGQPARAELLRTHEVVLRRPSDQAVVGHEWIYGDQVAIKGRVLRLSPLLNAAGVPNLFALELVFNGYLSAERHNRLPHQAHPIEPQGPLAVHPLWRRTQQRLLHRWEAGVEDGSSWVIRSSTIESTFFPLVDSDGKPVATTFRLVLTPGGLSAS